MSRTARAWLLRSPSVYTKDRTVHSALSPVARGPRMERAIRACPRSITRCERPRGSSCAPPSTRGGPADATDPADQAHVGIAKAPRRSRRVDVANSSNPAWSTRPRPVEVMSMQSIPCDYPRHRRRLLRRSTTRRRAPSLPQLRRPSWEGMPRPNPATRRTEAATEATTASPPSTSPSSPAPEASCCLARSVTGEAASH